MLQEIESHPPESQPAPRQDAPPPPSKPAALTGSLVQRGRDRGPRLSSVPILDAEPALPAPLAARPEPAAAFAPSDPQDEVPLVFVKPKKPVAARSTSRWSEAMFVAACCAAFFATFLFVLRF